MIRAVSIMWCIYSFICFLIYSVDIVYSCNPCSCKVRDWPGIWKNLKSADCRVKQNLSEIPKALDADIEGLILTDQHFTSLTETNFSRFKNLQTVSMFGNMIQSVHKDTFKLNKNLKHLSLSKNNITELPAELFSHNSNLTILWIYKNQIKLLKKGLFKNLPFLKDIHISNNSISVIQEACFVNLPSLELLDLRDNLLRTLYFYKDFIHLKSFYLSNNPWHCNDSLCAIMHKILMNYNQNNKTIMPVCSTPNHLSNKPWNQLKLNNFSPSIVTEEKYVEEGDILTLTCKYCFISNITWSLNNREISDKYHSQEDSVTSTITLTNVQKTDSGKYTCHVKDCNECNQAEVFIDVSYDDSYDEKSVASNIHFTHFLFLLLVIILI